MLGKLSRTCINSEQSSLERHLHTQIAYRRPHLVCPCACWGGGCRVGHRSWGDRSGGNWQTLRPDVARVGMLWVWLGTTGAMGFRELGGPGRGKAKGDSHQRSAARLARHGSGKERGGLSIRSTRAPSPTPSGLRRRGWVTGSRVTTPTPQERPLAALAGRAARRRYICGTLAGGRRTAGGGGAHHTALHGPRT